MQTNPAGTRGKSIDFGALAQELLSRIESLVPQWLPGGRREGHEYKGAPQRSGGDGDSWSVNLKSGVWAHFAGDEKGGDLIALYAAIYGRTQIDAAKELIEELNLAHVAYSASSASVPSSQPLKQRAPNLAAPKPISAPTDRGEFVSITPVPPHANQPPATHPYRGTPERVWHYQRDGESLGYVYRFATSDGGKEVLPLTWCQSQANDTQKWTWKTWAAPRPLYLAGGTLRPIVHRLIVEGEKCADAAHALLGDQFDVVSWPGGGKAEHHANWAWLTPDAADTTPRRAYLWPDCDGKRRKPSPEEKATGVDPKTLPLLPEDKQPGNAAMAKIAATLHALGVEVWLIPIPKPLEVVDGWDVADAIAEGWDAAKLQAFIDKAQRWIPEKSADENEKKTHENVSGKSSAGAGDDEGPQAWRIALLRSATGNILAIRENIVLALQSIPSVVGNIAFNEFANTITKLTEMPWGSPAGNWTEVDELLMGEWLTRSHFMPSVPRGTLEEAIRMVATRHQYHPVRAYLADRQWDGTKRLNTWLARAVCADPAALTRNQAAYMARVGAWFLMGMVARAMQPGCKFDYMPIFEGSQGMRKSTILNVLAGEWFADTGFVLGDKDSLQMLQGRWLYEISELDAMARAEVTKIKAFVASKADWYRASFDKRPREYPRQLVFAGTTNEHQYLVDGTGNRRFWPIDVTRIIDTEWVAENRDQLFAEAKQRWESGERFHPTQDEELRLFLPQQRSRMVESPIEVRLLDYLVNNHDGMILKEVKIVSLLSAIGIDITKLGPGRFHEKQAGTALKKFGWVRVRSSYEGRPWVYKKPEGWPACMSLDDLDDSPPIGQMKGEAIIQNRPTGAQAPADHLPKTNPSTNPADVPPMQGNTGTTQSNDDDLPI